MEKQVHLIGIGGSGLSAIALVLLESGYEVSGSDRQLSPLALRVQAAGGRVFAGHRAENLGSAGLVVRSSAIPDDNVEVQAAQAAGIPVLKRADFLGRLMEGSLGIAVAGTHGKTTTTAMIAWILTALGKDPTYIIGSVAANLESNAHAGRGPHFVIEADEYDRMFLGLRPQVEVVTNIEHDHPDCYPTGEDLYQAFRAFVDRLPPGGALLACADDPGAARLLVDVAGTEHRAGMGVRRLPYGIGDEGKTARAGRPEGAGYAYQARNLTPNAAGGFDFEYIRRPENAVQPVSLQVPGEHNVRNALAALAAADVLGLPAAAAAQALGEFRGTGRRFEVRGEAAGITLVDDYAHHPTEIRATLAAARFRFPGRRIWAVWQPHTFSRTLALFAGFASAFKDAERVVVTEVYAARETAPAGGFSARQVVEAMHHPGAHFVPGLEQAEAYLLAHLQPGDAVLVLSAGDADLLTGRLLAELAERSAQEG